MWFLVLEFGLKILVELAGSWLLRDCRDTKDPIYIVSGYKMGGLGTTCGGKQSAILERFWYQVFQSGYRGLGGCDLGDLQQ